MTYAASPLWSDGTYDWEDALEVSREALAVLLTHDYKLFDNVPSPGIAQNPYALYFITSSDDRRSTDKETILQVGAQMEVWRQAGLPSTPGQLKAGPCPSQELVDCYETVDGEPVLDLANPYEDDAHRQPNYNLSTRPTIRRIRMRTAIRVSMPRSITTGRSACWAIPATPGSS